MDPQFLDPDSIFIFVVQDPGMPKWHSSKNLVFRRAEFYLFLSRALEVFPGAWKAFIVDKYLDGPDPEDQSLRIHPDPTLTFLWPLRKLCYQILS